jgi:hypothetical protein
MSKEARNLTRADFYRFDAISASVAMVFMLRAVPVFAAGMRNFESPTPLG